MRNVLHYWSLLIKKSIWPLLLLIVIGACDVFLSLKVITVSKLLIDTATGAVSGKLINVLLIFGLIMFSSIMLYAFSSIFSVRFRTRLGNEIRINIFRDLLSTQWLKLQSYHSGDVMSRINSDVGEVVSLVSQTIPNLISILLKLIGAFVMLYMMDSTLAIILLFLIPVVLIVSKLYFKKMRAYSRAIKDASSNVHLFFQESIQNGGIVKALRLDKLFIRILDERQNQYREKIKKQNNLSLFSNVVLSFGFSFGYILVFGWSAFQLQAGVITFGMMTAYLQLVNTIQSPALSLLYTIPTFISAYTSTERLLELKTLPKEKKNGNDLLLKNIESVSVCNISFGYSKDKLVLNDCSVVFHRGTMTALVGKTGSGKTTLIRLMLAMMPVDKGHIYLEANGNTYPVSVDTRINFSYVPQHCYLFSGTVRENMKMGNLNATDEQILEALRKTSSDFILESKDGLDMVINEGGKGLSGGQIQRLSIARALLSPAEILLLDEITSALDTTTEQEIIASIRQLVSDKIVIFVTHNDNVVDACDFVYRIKE